MKTIHYIDTPEGVIAMWKLLLPIKDESELFPDAVDIPFSFYDPERYNTWGSKGEHLVSLKRDIIKNKSINPYQTGDTTPPRVCPKCEGYGENIHIRLDSASKSKCNYCKGTGEIKYTLEKVELKQFETIVDIDGSIKVNGGFILNVNPGTYLGISLATRIKK
jgi:hypothetical protein